MVPLPIRKSKVSRRVIPVAMLLSVNGETLSGRLQVPCTTVPVHIARLVSFFST